MERGTAGDDEDLVDLAQFLIGQPLLVKNDAVVDEVAEQRVGNGGGLLGDLLEHEVLVAALFGGRGVPVDVEGPVVLQRISRGAIEVGDAVAVGGDHDRLILAELDCLAGVLDERRDVRADEHLPVADPEHQRRGAAGGHDCSRLVGVGEHQREMPFEPAQHRQCRGREVPGVLTAVEFARDHVHCHFSVGVAGELHPEALELGTQRGVVLDDAVVDHRHLAGGVTVRVRIAVGRPAVGGPPGVSEPGGTDELIGPGLAQRTLQVGQAARLAAHGETTAAVEERHSGRIVAPVLHAP